MKDFVTFLLAKVYDAKTIPSFFCEEAFRLTCLDVKYHFPSLSTEEVKNRIFQNQNELAIYLFRLGNVLHLYEQEELKFQMHWLLKEICGCEIYFNNQIDTGFYVVHGQGTVVGSRNKIGKGFKIHHGCTIGHKKNGAGNGNVIGDNVTVYANSSIIGELEIGNGVIIGSHLLITKNIEDGKVITQKSISELYYQTE
jgi:serine O-acetyltransferase